MIDGILTLAFAGIMIGFMAWDNKKQRESVSVLKFKVDDWERGSVRIKEALSGNFDEIPFIHEFPNIFSGHAADQIEKLIHHLDEASTKWQDAQKLIAEIDSEADCYQDFVAAIKDERNAATDLARCYLLSREQARGDIEGIKRNYVKVHPESVQLEAIFGDIGKKFVPKVSKKTAAKTKKVVTRGK